MSRTESRAITARVSRGIPTDSIRHEATSLQRGIAHTRLAISRGPELPELLHSIRAYIANPRRFQGMARRVGWHCRWHRANLNPSDGRSRKSVLHRATQSFPLAK